jgi:carbon monoxide dehydrogenase subunit G
VLIENAFTVNAHAGDLWSVLLDVERIAPCMPGAELTEVIDERNWKGKVHVKVGPVAMSFAGTVSMESRDDEAHRVVLRAKGTEQKGKGAADASVTSWREPGAEPDQTTVKMQAEIALVGAAAQMSRGLLPEISKKLTQQFANCLEAAMAAQEPARAAPPEATPAERATSAPAAVAPRPVGGIGLALSAIWQVIKGFIRRLFGGRG